jgi:DNA-binding PadR family transcriptional regulator
VSVPHALLALLSEGPKYGLRLQNEFESRTGEVWPLNVGQVYTTLSRLERDGLVEPAGAADESGKVVYRITAAGRAELSAWFDEPIEHDARPRDELVIKLAMAIATPGVDALAVIDAQRAAAHRAIRAATRRKAGTDLATELVAEAAIFAAEAEVRWLDHCEQVLLSRPPAPPGPAAPALPHPADLTRSVTS